MTSETAGPRTPADPDVEALADLFMDLRLDGPARNDWTYQQTARHYAGIIIGRWLAGIRTDPNDPLAKSVSQDEMTAEDWEDWREDRP